MSPVSFIETSNFTKSFPFMINATEIESLQALYSYSIVGNTAFENLGLTDVGMFYTVNEVNPDCELEEIILSHHRLFKTSQIKIHFSTKIVITTSSLELKYTKVEEIEKDLQKGYMKLLSNQ